jgi:hypothetical protein
MNVEIRNEAGKFRLWKSINRILFAVWIHEGGHFDLMVLELQGTNAN